MHHSFYMHLLCIQFLQSILLSTINFKAKNTRFIFAIFQNYSKKKENVVVQFFCCNYCNCTTSKYHVHCTTSFFSLVVSSCLATVVFRLAASPCFVAQRVVSLLLGADTVRTVVTRGKRSSFLNEEKNASSNEGIIY